MGGDRPRVLWHRQRSTARRVGAPLAPGLFTFGGTAYVAATHADGSLIGPLGLYPGLSTPAKPGETIVLYGNGFGPTSVPVVNGSTIQSGTLTPSPTVTIGGVPASVQFSGLVAPGEFQFNVTIPPTVLDGDLPVALQQSGTSTPAGNLVTVHR